MKSTLVSDVHIRGVDDPRQLALVELLESWPTDAWVLVGDVFDVWWGWSTAVFVDGVPLLAALHRLRRRGIAVTWVPGNHDFHPGDAVQAGLGLTVLPEWVELTAHGPIRAVHGDLPDSAAQRAVDRLLRGRATRVAARLLGPDTTWRVARRVSGASRARQRSPSERLLARQAAFAQRRLQAGDAVVCVGHSHAPGIQPLRGGRLINLGDFAQHRTFADVEHGEVRLLRWHDRRALGVEGEPRRRLDATGAWAD